ncbi:hypothetical protein [Methylophaga thiooxydans]|uniref:hypothetical protein n=1 Tax=Methylophaga thiooxydans TaxID=392484 RepID=UPI0023555403|nr:hypothetical protein [Methylophaga thiooxydans]
MKIVGNDSNATISFEKAKAKRLVDDLRSYLGTSAKGGWIPLMYKLKEELPFLFSKGSPGKKLKSSFVGKAGFHTLHAFIVEGMGWSMSEWRASSKAFKYVLEYDYLSELKPKPSEINKLAGKVDQFPVSQEEWLVSWAKIDADNKNVRKNNLATLTKEKQTLIKEIDNLQKFSEQELNHSEKKLKLNEKELELTKKELIVTGKKVHKIFKAISALKSEYSEELSWWQRLTKKGPDVLDDLIEIEKELDQLVKDLVVVVNQAKGAEIKKARAA